MLAALTSDVAQEQMAIGRIAVPASVDIAVAPSARAQAYRNAAADVATSDWVNPHARVDFSEFVSAWMYDGERACMACYDSRDPLLAMRARMETAIKHQASAAGNTGVSWERAQVVDRIMEMHARIEHQAQRFGYGPDMPLDRLGRLTTAIAEVFHSCSMPSQESGVRWARNAHYLEGLRGPPPRENTVDGCWRPAADDLLVAEISDPQFGPAVDVRVRSGFADLRQRVWAGSLCIREASWSAGTIDGTCTRRRANGEITTESLLHGIRHGRCETVDAGGTRVYRGTFILDRLHGQVAISTPYGMRQYAYDYGSRCADEMSALPSGAVQTSIFGD